MSAQINHVAIVSDNYAQLAKFYEAMFGMKSSGLQRSASAVTVGDGYVGLNINPRRAGRSAGLDHFGIQVDDVETVFERMRKNYPSVNGSRAINRPFAGITTHDRMQRVDLSRRLSNRAAIYVENDGSQPRHRSRRGAHHASDRDGTVLPRCSSSRRRTSPGRSATIDRRPRHSS